MPENNASMAAVTTGLVTIVKTLITIVIPE